MTPQVLKALWQNTLVSGSLAELNKSLAQYMEESVFDAADDDTQPHPCVQQLRLEISLSNRNTGEVLTELDMDFVCDEPKILSRLGAQANGRELLRFQVKMIFTQVLSQMLYVIVDNVEANGQLTPENLALSHIDLFVFDRITLNKELSPLGQAAAPRLHQALATLQMEHPLFPFSWFFPELEPFAELASSSAMRGGVSLQLDSASSQRGQGQRPQYKTKRKTKSKRKA